MIYRLSKDNATFFESTNRDEFLQLCVTEYDEVADDTWEKYKDPSELPAILEKHGYVYEEIEDEPSNRKSYTDMLMLYYEIAKWNQGCSFGDASNVLSVTQQFLINYNAQCLAYLDDESEEKSLIRYLAGDDGLAQWNMYKGIYQQYGVHIF